jgi:hypothetical protein
MTPTGYKARYEDLQVPLASGKTVSIRVNQYKRRGQKGHDVDEAAEQAFFDALAKHHVDMTLRVDPGTLSVSATQQTGPKKVDSSFLQKVSTMARYVFVGKGAPEHCQIVLQLVDHWKLAPSGLQDYADKALGLDCNGFVGNYLWHGRDNSKQAWDSLGLGKHDEGPDVSIDGYFDRRRAIRKWEELSSARSYIMGLVDSAGRIIPGGSTGSEPGHIAITEPGRFRPATGSQSPAVWSVEATAAHEPGLWESWYSLIKVDRSGIFTMNREDMISGHQERSFRIAPV